LKVLSAGTERVVVTDLDGSLLDESYCWTEAGPALTRLRDVGVPLVLNSSKTFAEMRILAEELDLRSPLVAENGGVLAVPIGEGVMEPDQSQLQSDGYRILVNGLSREAIVTCAHELRAKENYRFAGFADWSCEEIAERTGLSEPMAQCARSRFATEPIVWEDTERRRAAFESALSEHQIRILSGGRFLHLMGPDDKADGMAAALAHLRVRRPDLDRVVIAVGDSANDLGMLEAADIAVVIPHPDGPRIQPDAPRVVYAEFPSSKGWNAALLTILSECT
jgi:mannosyl-3-phosphoglycerate phosphatase